MSVDHRIMNRRLKFALLAYQVGIALLVLKPLLIIFGLRFNAHEWLAGSQNVWLLAKLSQQ